MVMEGGCQLDWCPVHRRFHSGGPCSEGFPFGAVAVDRYGSTFDMRTGEVIEPARPVGPPAFESFMATRGPLQA